MDEFSKRIDENIGRVPDFPSPGIQFKDISTLFQNPQLVDEMVDVFAAFSRGKVDAVCGIESRGFLFGLLIAQKLKLPFVLIRKVGKLPPPTVSESYELEYGNAVIEMQPKFVRPGMRFLIHDDVLGNRRNRRSNRQTDPKMRRNTEPVQFYRPTFIAGRKTKTSFVQL